MQATVTLAWTYSPEGAVLLGEEGPVTNLDCSGNTIYDFSTGLIFKNGRYFDPANGLWITLSGVVVWQAWPPDNRSQRRRKHRNSKRNRKWILLLLLLLYCGKVFWRLGSASRRNPPSLLVAAIEFSYDSQLMCNLTIATAHTYSVGEGQWLVHNA